MGVAISASLLPPAVNAGFFWALSLLVAATGGNVGMYGPKVILIFTNLASRQCCHLYVYEKRTFTPTIKHLDYKLDLS